MNLAAPPVPPLADAARVMIVDDSVVIRGAIARMLEGEATVRVVARVANGRQALEEVKRQHIDVAVLDIEMPEMDGMEALPLLLRADPGLRVVMASTLTSRGADVALRALRLGAADYIPKPSTAAIAERVLQLRSAPKTRPRLLAVGSSTGGPQALFAFVRGLGGGLPVPAVLTQHMPPAFTPMLAEHLTKLGVAPCAEARDGEALEAGRLYLAPGDRHLLVEAVGPRLVARLSDAPAENYCRPSIDPMLRSAVVACGGAVLMVMLTGMGHDGLAGTREVVAAGGAALAQDEATSVVWGMPGAIAQAGLCHKILPVAMLAGATLDLLKGGRP